MKHEILDPLINFSDYKNKKNAKLRIIHQDNDNESANLLNGRIVMNDENIIYKILNFNYTSNQKYIYHMLFK